MFCHSSAELGDYDNDEQVKSYVEEYQILPPVRGNLWYPKNVIYLDGFQNITSSATIKSLLEKTTKLYQRHR